MKNTVINILDQERRFRYIFEYQDDLELSEIGSLGYEVSKDDSRIDFYDSYTNLRREGNEWYPYEGTHLLSEHLPSDHYNISSINIYFPEYGVETYEKDVDYALTINTWIHGKYVYLGTYLINRRDAIACDKVREFDGARYYEYINLKIIDPWYLVYGDEWREFRQMVCGEEEYDNHELNNTGSILNISLYPIEYIDNKYIKLNEYIGGQNAINLSDTYSDYISYHISRDEYYGYEERVYGVIKFNTSYDQDFEGFKLYIKETYGIDNFILRYEFVVKDSENIYKSQQFLRNDITCTLSSKDFRFDSWSGFKEGMMLVSSVDIIVGEDEYDEDSYPTISLVSNEIPFTQDVMKYYVGDIPFNHVTISLVDMKVYNINTVNKIEKNVVKVDRPNDYKSNIIKPVYYKVKDLAALILHPNVTEDICINLDAYKSTVDTFIIQIEGVSFVESARVSAGVIFKIIGNSVPHKVESGVYYILNQDSELVTTGKFTYEV